MTLEAAKASIQPGQTVQYKSRKATVIKKYEHHFLVKAGGTYECFTYADVITGDVKVVNDR